MDANEAHHPRCLAALRQHAGAAAMAVHSLAECFATLTGKLGFAPSDAAHLVQVNCFENLTIISLTAREYLRTLHAAERRGVRGGAIYDALLLESARKSRAQKIYTLNVRHFAAFAPDLEQRIMAP